MYTLHMSADSASLIVRLVLEELGVPYTSHLIDRAGGALDSPAYRALQPMGLIPAMETPDGPIFETGAILLYLAERHRGLAPDPTDPDRAAFLSWFVFTNNAVHTTAMQMFYPERTGGPEGRAVVLALATARMRGYLSLIDRMILDTAPGWLSAGRASVLGYYLGVLVRWLASFGPDHASFVLAADYPALHAVLAAHEVRPAARACAEAEGLGPTLFTNPAY